jgi:mitochondrial distribution and morphology protein 34
MLAAKQPLVVPMLLRLSHFKLNSYVVLVVSKQKGITVVFKTDPLQHVDINSTFDSIAAIQKFIQREIEGQLRQMFREDLPGIIHRLSQQWVKAKVEAPYLAKRHNFSAASLPLDQVSETRSLPEPSYAPSSVEFPHVGTSRSLSGPLGARRAKSSSGLSATNRKSAPVPIPSIPPATDDQSPSALPDIENFDPTYGLRPEGLPAKSLFGQFRRLFAQTKGLAELSEELSEEEVFDDEGGSFDLLPWDDLTMQSVSPSSLDSQTGEDGKTDDMGYETIPAVGGGLITRPRVYHSQSQIENPVVPSLQSSKHSTTFPRRSGLSDYELSIHPSFRPSPLSNTHFINYDPSSATRSSDTLSYDNQPKMEMPSLTPFLHSPTALAAHITAPKLSQSGRFTVPPTPPLSDSHTEPGNSPTPVIQSLGRRSSVSSSIPDGFHSGSPPDHHGTLSSDPDPKIILRPSFNNHISKLSTLSHSNHTLSPYTRSLEHFTVRSVPPRGLPGTTGLMANSDRQPCVKAKRKRIYRLGSANKDRSMVEKAPEEPPPPPMDPPSDFDASDMDRYFRWRDEVAPHFPPDVNPSHIRRRHSKQK